MDLAFVFMLSFSNCFLEWAFWNAAVKSTWDVCSCCELWLSSTAKSFSSLKGTSRAVAQLSLGNRIKKYTSEQYRICLFILYMRCQTFSQIIYSEEDDQPFVKEMWSETMLSKTLVAGWVFKGKKNKRIQHFWRRGLLETTHVLKDRKVKMTFQNGYGSVVGCSFLASMEKKTLPAICSSELFFQFDSSAQELNSCFVVNSWQ